MEAYKRLEATYAELEKVNERNRQLLHILTHDIANPLSVITTGFYILEKSKDKVVSLEKFRIALLSI